MTDLPARRRLLAIATVVTGLALAACSAGAGTSPRTDNPTETDVVGAPAPTTSTVGRGTPALDTTAASSTSPGEQQPTTAPPPTYTVPTTLPLPQPVPPPIDLEAPEPVVQLGRLAIPRLGVDSTLYEGIHLPTFDLGPGHWPGSALPGKRGNMVVGGHRTSSNADFRNIDQLVVGDQVIVTNSRGRAFTYAVAGVEIVDPFAARIIYQTQERTATLFACHPPGSVDQRIVVHLTLA